MNMFYQYYIFFSWYLGDQQIQIEIALINGFIAFMSSLIFILYVHLCYFPRIIFDAPKIITFPPLIMLLSLSIGFLIGVLNLYYFQIYTLPVSFDILRSKFVGLALMIVFFILIFLSVGKFRENNEDPNPIIKSNKLITSGIFSYIRNPMYLALLFFQLGVGSLLSFLHISIFTLFTFYLLNKLIVFEEEKYLLVMFGKEYEEYKNKSRRWL